jgi:hypothetical protein
MGAAAKSDLPLTIMWFPLQKKADHRGDDLLK